jgi:hypothetical protein
VSGRHSFSRLLVAAAILLTIFPAAAGALSPEQKDIYSSGIYFFDADTGSSGCTIGNGSLPGTVPPPYNGIFTAAAAKFNIPGAFLAALFYAGEHGSSWPEPPAPYGHGSPWADSHVTGGNAPWPNGEHDGAAGPFQFEYPAWTSHGQDGNGDSIKDVEDLTDASFAGANYLAALGAKNTTDTAKLHDAARSYNGTGSQAEAYADKVMAAYQQFSGGSSITATAAVDQSSICSSTVNLGPLNIKQVNAFGTGDGLMGHPPTMIGVHYTAGNEQTAQDVISDLQDADGSKHCNHVTHSCSVQLTVLPDGSIYQLTSSLDVKTENIINFNDADIGIEIAGPNEQALLKNQVQFNAVVSLIAQLMQKYNIKMEQNFINKAGLMGHMECDAWSDAHKGTIFSGQYGGEIVQGTDGHQDPGPSYMSKVRDAVGSATAQ